MYSGSGVRQRPSKKKKSIEGLFVAKRGRKERKKNIQEYSCLFGKATARGIMYICCG